MAIPHLLSAHNSSMPPVREAASLPAPAPRRRVPWWQRALLLAPPADLEAHNTRALYLDAAYGGMATNVAIYFLPVLAVRLGASDLEVGALNAGPYLAGLLWSLPAGRMAGDRRHLLPVLLSSLSLYRFSCLLVALILLVLPRFQVEALVILNSLAGIPFVTINIALYTLFAHVLSAERMARVLSLRLAITSLTSMLGLLLAGVWLEQAPFPFNYQVMFIALFLIGMVNVWYFSRLRLLDQGAPPRPQPAPSWRVRWQGLRRERRYLLFLTSATFLHLAINAAAALYPIFVVNHLGASDGWVSLLLTIFTATTFLGALWTERFLQRWGTRHTLSVSMLGLGIYTIFLATAPSVPFLIPAHILGGIMAAGFNVGLANGLVEYCPEEGRTDFVALYMFLMNVAVFVGPLLGSALSTAWDVVTALLIVAALRVASGLAFYLLKY